MSVEATSEKEASKEVKEAETAAKEEKKSDKEIIAEVEEKLKDYVTDKKIVSYRNLAERLSKETLILFTKEDKTKAKLMRWFKNHFDQLSPYLEQRKAALELERIKKENGVL